MKLARALQLSLVSTFALATASCTFINEFKYGSQINELNTVMNTQKISFSVGVQLNDDSEIILNTYSDGEKIIQTSPLTRSVREIFYKDAYLLEGNGFKVLIGANNESLITNKDGNLNMRDYITSVSKESTSDLLITTINYEKMASVLGIELDTSDFSVLGVDSKKVPFHITYQNGIITGFAFVFDDYVNALNPIYHTYRTFYTIYGYGKYLNEEKIDLSKYTKVDMETLLVVQRDIQLYIEHKPGLSFSPLNRYMSVPNPEDVIGVLYFRDNGDTVCTITFGETIYNEERQECTYYYAGRAFYLQLYYGQW